jgi:hypothetical protein
MLLENFRLYDVYMQVCRLMRANRRGEPMEKGLGEMFHALSYCLPNTNLGYISKVIPHTGISFLHILAAAIHCT